MRQYRVCVSPTLMRYSRGSLEETNRVIRQFKSTLPAFIRLNFVNEYSDKGFYFGESSHYLLGYIHKVMQNGINLGNRHFNFLVYSNSALKNHSCWFLCRNDDVNVIDKQEIETYMGDFSKEHNILK